MKINVDRLCVLAGVNSRKSRSGLIREAAEAGYGVKDRSAILEYFDGKISSTNS